MGISPAVSSPVPKYSKPRPNITLFVVFNALLGDTHTNFVLAVSCEKATIIGLFCSGKIFYRMFSLLHAVHGV